MTNDGQTMQDNIAIFNSQTHVR